MVLPIMLTVLVVLNLALIVRRLQVRKRAGEILFRGRTEKMHWILWADLIVGIIYFVISEENGGGRGFLPAIAIALLIPWLNRFEYGPNGLALALKFVPKKDIIHIKPIEDSNELDVIITEGDDYFRLVPERKYRSVELQNMLQPQKERAPFLNIYIGIKYKEDMSNQADIERMSAFLEAAGARTYCTVRDMEAWGRNHVPPALLMEESLKQIDRCDLVLIELSEKGVGLGIEAGYAHARKKPVIIIAKLGSDISLTVWGVANRIIIYADDRHLQEQLGPVVKSYLNQEENSVR
ncbi:nucleoside 2-deoxyribosyltransferase [Paenibacillus enshidis]|uniref:Nucleoside 2-deoxyribosyltransferase n=1 Tax=Paenibacillus enshidis TaxID=1458439 RepID=A0ABV5AQJ9_9BACL